MPQNLPTTQGFAQPAEWAHHQACWLAWPSHGDLWRENLPAAQIEFAALCRAIVDMDPTTGRARGEPLEILVPDQARLEDAKTALKGLPARFHLIPFGDIWVRDTAPVFLLNAAGEQGCVRFGFNGWGGKYSLPGDDQVSARVALASTVKTFEFPWILEGGSLDVDGEGSVLTTRQCLMNPNRNPSMNQESIEKGLCESLGVSKVLWLKDGLLNDHTDGHVDTIARFVAPGVVVCMQAMDPATDPNTVVLDEIAHDLAAMKDAKGRSLKVVRVPSPGKLTDEDGRVLPASYVNFYIGNSTVVVPTYGSKFDAPAVEAISKLFPKHRTIGSSAYAILSGGGAFHCITQQQPSGAKS
jgi:agmatine deiminase